MPKKHQQRALRIKPQASSPHSLSLSKSYARPHNDSSQRSVNDLLRQSRQVQLRSDTRPPPPTENAHSVHPTVRAVLDLPPPTTPAPRPGVESFYRAIGASSGPSRLRRIPGPPPPRSWLKDSIHAPASLRNARGDDGNGRLQVRSSNLPDGAFPPPRSLQDAILKKMASDWEWHAENDGDYFTYLPVRLREVLLSYIAVYGNNVKSNPLKTLLLHETDAEEREEVQRLDLSNSLGHWTTFKQLGRDLMTKSTASQNTPNVITLPTEPTPESWDGDSDTEDFANSLAISFVPKTAPNFANLKHLSLAISPSNSRAASWSSLISLATELRTLTSLSLAYWPQPTFTPVAASTRAIIPSPGGRSVVYGGTDIYTSFDNNWREAAGILRSLSRSLYCLKWLDLTGCGDWFAALQWTASPSFSPPSSPEIASASTPAREPLAPEWNGGWRGLEKIILEVGWKPILASPEEEDQHGPSVETSWGSEHDRIMYRYSKDWERFTQIQSTARSVARHLREIRRHAGGRYIDVQVGEELVPLVDPQIHW